VSDRHAHADSDCKADYHADMDGSSSGYINASADVAAQPACQRRADRGVPAAELAS
jgi:hypothetical protein